MKQEEKELLLKDICARLPYLVKGLYQWKNNTSFDRVLDGDLYDEIYLSLYSTEDSSFRPYLRPMSSMTEEEKEEYDKTFDWDYSIQGTPFDWLNAHHFDYHGFIEKGLALEATEGMYKIDKLYLED